MKNSTPDFPPLNSRQKSIISNIESLKAELAGLALEDKERRWEIKKKIDDLTVKAARFLIKNDPDGDRSYGLFLLFIDENNQASVIIADCLKLHPEAPVWFVEHFFNWTQGQRLREKGREILRKTKIVGLETGMRRPKNIDLMIKVLELRGFVDEEDPLVSAIANAIANEPPLDMAATQKDIRLIPYSLAELQERSRRIVADEMRKIARLSSTVLKKKKKRPRKERVSLNWVIKQLVKEGSLPKIISHQALKKMLKTRYPDWPWEEV